MCVAAVLFPKLERLFMGKLADDLRPKSEHAHPDQRLEISLLGLFSYDRFSIVPPEKGWILPLLSYLSKLVLQSMSGIKKTGIWRGGTVS